MRNIYILGEGTKNKILYESKLSYKEAKGSSGALKIFDILKIIQKNDSSLFNIAPIDFSINKAKGLIINDTNETFYTNLEESLIIPFDDMYSSNDIIIISTLIDSFINKYKLDKILDSQTLKLISLNSYNINQFSKKIENAIFFITENELKKIYPKIKLDLSYEETLKSIMDIKYINNFNQICVLFPDYLIYIENEIVDILYYFDGASNLNDFIDVFLSGVAYEFDTVIESLKRGIRLLEGYHDNGYLKEQEYIINAINSIKNYNLLSFEYEKMLITNSIIEASKNVNDISIKIIKEPGYIKNILNYKINDLYLVSKAEIDEYKIINKLIKEYLKKASFKPLGFGIIGKNYNDLTYNIREIMKYENHQIFISNEDSFINSYDEIRNSILKGITPVVFIKDYKGSKVIDDVINNNLIMINYKEYVMGKSIFIILSDNQETFKNSNIINSIKGIYNHLGINAINEFDFTYKLRRALFLRRINTKEIEENLLKKLLEIDLKYEEKSLSSILEMSGNVVSYSTLPNDIFLGLHLDINELYNESLSQFEYMMLAKKLLDEDYDKNKNNEIDALKHFIFSINNLNLKIEKSDEPLEFVLKLDELDLLSKINYEYRTNKKYELLNDKEKAKERFNIKLIVRYLNEIKYEIKYKNVV